MNDGRQNLRMPLNENKQNLVECSGPGFLGNQTCSLDCRVLIRSAVRGLMTTSAGESLLSDLLSLTKTQNYKGIFPQEE